LVHDLTCAALQGCHREFGAAYTVNGSRQVDSVFEKIATQFSDCSSFDIE
jgi:hypothetical protein